MGAKAILADVVLAAAALTAVTSLLDWFLSDTQKARLVSCALRVWNWLDDAQKRSANIRFDDESVLRKVLIVTLFSALCFFIVWGFGTRDVGLLMGLLAGWSGWVAFLFIPRFVAVREEFLLQPLAIRVIFYGLFFLILYVACAISESDFVLSFSIGLAFGRGLVSIFFSVAFTVGLLFLALVLIPGLKMFLKGLEVTARRIAESPTGPMVANSSLVGCIAALAKVFD
jgi:hypothetical protein